MDAIPYGQVGKNWIGHQDLGIEFPQHFFHKLFVNKIFQKNDLTVHQNIFESNLAIFYVFPFTLDNSKLNNNLIIH